MLWLRLWHSFLDSVKVQSVTEALRARYVNLLCVACKADQNGKLPDICQVAFMIRLSVEETQQTLDALVSAKLIDRRAKAYWIHDWDHWQYGRSKAAEKQARYRNNKKQGGNALRNGEVTRDVTNPSRAGAGARSEERRGEKEKEGEGDAPAPLSPDDPVSRECIEVATRRWGACNGDSVIGELLREYKPAWVRTAMDREWDVHKQQLNCKYLRGILQGYMATGGPPAPSVATTGRTAPRQASFDVSADVMAEQTRKLKERMEAHEQRERERLAL